MARVAEWAVTEASGRQHRVLVDRAPLFGVRVTVDKRQVERFDQTPESDRFVRSLGGHVLTVVIPRVSNDQPTLHVDGKPVLGTETTLPAPLAGASDATGAAVSSQDLVRFQLLQRRNSGGAWFYWIGGASILNSVLNEMDGFAVSLVAGITVIFAGFLLTNAPKRVAMHIVEAA